MLDTVTSSQPLPGTPPPAPSAGVPVTVEYRPKPGLFRLSVINFLLMLITLSIYRFWARTRVRRHIWSCVHVNGEPLEYTGTGRELFFGALIIFCLLILPYALIVGGLTLYFGPEHWSTIVAPFFFLSLFVVLYGLAVYVARRYRLSRTLWRGIRGALVGSPWSYTMKYFGSILLSFITLGWSTPAMNLALEDQLTNDMRFGSEPFRFHGEAGPLYTRYALCWFGTLVIVVGIIAYVAYVVFQALGQDASTFFEDLDRLESLSPERQMAIGAVIIAGIGGFFALLFVLAVLWTSYSARELSVFARYTSFNNARLQLDATTWSLIGLWVGNLFIIILTIGILTPYAHQRIARYFCKRLKVIGTVDIAGIQQSSAKLPRRGEGLADAFDIGAI